MHPLDGAYERVKRADEHLIDLDSRVDAISKTIGDSIVVYSEPKSHYEAGEVLGAFKIELPEVPHIVKILVGEIIYNLRAALDYLIYELARYDSGSIQYKTQFSIEDSKDIFWGRHKGNLKGLNGEHIAAIELLQPYNGCDWTKLIRDLSDPDKHRQLTISKTSTQYIIHIPVGKPSTEVPPVNSPVNMNNSATVHVKFSAGSTIMDIDTLNELKSQVTKTLDAFNSEFK